MSGKKLLTAAGILTLLATFLFSWATFAYGEINYLYGVGGLINAYRTGAQLALEASTIVERTINIDYLITCDYDVINKVMRVIKEKNLNITDQKLELDCQIWISVRKKEAANIFSMFDSLFNVTIKKTES